MDAPLLSFLARLSAADPGALVWVRASLSLLLVGLLALAVVGVRSWHGTRAAEEALQAFCLGFAVGWRRHRPAGTTPCARGGDVPGCSGRT